MSVVASTLFDSNKLNSKGYDSAWIGNKGALQKVIKTIENYTLYNLVQTSPKSDIGLKVYLDNGKYDFGFGCRHARGSVPLNIVYIGKSTEQFKTYTKAEYSGSKVYKTEKGDKGNATDYYKSGMVIIPRDGLSAIECADELSNVLMREAIVDTWKAMKKIGLTDINVVTDNELAAIADIVYNMGSGYCLGSKRTKSLTEAFKAHQNAKKTAKNVEDLVTLQNTVCDVILKYRLSGGQPSDGLMKRRVADVRMYRNDTTGNFNVAAIIDAEVSAMYGGSYTTASGFEGGEDKTAEQAAATMHTMSGDSSDLANAIQTGDTTLIKNATEKAKAAIKAKKAAEAAKLEAGNPTYKTYEASEVDVYTPTLNYVTDSRAMAGLAVPEHVIYDTSIKDGNKNNTFDDRSFYNKTNFLGRFKKYDQVTDDDLGQAKKTKLFMTRPDMCLYQNSSSTSNKSDENYLTPSLQCGDPDLIDHLTIDRDLYIYLDRHIAPSYLDTNIAFIPSFTNQFRTSNLPEVNFAMTKSAMNTQGVAVSIPTYDSTDTAESTFAVNFNVDDHMAIHKYIDLIFKYAKSIKEKTTIAYPESIKYNVLDFSTTIFMFVLAQDGLTIESYYRAVGCVPTNNPINSIPLNAQAEKIEQMTVNFKPGANIDSRKLQIINHFNFLNRMGCEKLKYTTPLGDVLTYNSAINWFMINYNILESWLLDNMKASDWYCERYQIYLDTDNNRNVYKLVPIPTMDRLYQLLQLVTSKSEIYNGTIFGNLINRADSNMNQVLIKNTSQYKKYNLNTTESKKNVDTSYKSIQLHLDSATREMISAARKVPAYHGGVMNGRRSFGPTDLLNTKSPANMFDIFTENTDTYGQRMHTMISKNSNAYGHLRTFLSNNSKLWNATVGEKNEDSKGLIVTNYIFLNAIYGYDSINSNDITKLRNSTFSDKGLFLKKDMTNVVESTVNYDAIYSVESYINNEKTAYKIKVRKTEDLLNANTSTTNKDFTNLVKNVDSADSTNSYHYNLKEIPRSKGPMNAVAPNGLFLVEDPVEASNHGNILDKLEGRVHSAYLNAKVSGEIASNVNANYAILSKYMSDVFSFYDRTYEVGNQLYKQDLSEFIKEYWNITRLDSATTDGKVTYKKDKNNTYSIIDPSKWYLEIQSSGRLYERRLGKMPFLADIEANTAKSGGNSGITITEGGVSDSKNTESSGETTFTVKATTTYAKIVMNNEKMWESTYSGDKDSLVRENATGKVLSYDPSRTKISNPDKVIDNIPQKDASSVNGEIRESYHSFMDATSKVLMGFGDSWSGFYLMNPDTKKVTTYINSKIYGKESLKYKIFLSAYNGLFMDDVSSHDNKVIYSSTGMKDIYPGMVPTSKFRDARVSGITPDYGSGYSLFADAEDTANSISKYKHLLPNTIKANEESSFKLSWKQIVLEQIKTTAISTAKTFLLQTISTVLSTTIAKLLYTKDKDIKNQKSAGITIEALDYVRFSRDMRSNYAFNVDEYTEKETQEKRTLQIDDFTQEIVTTPEYTFSEIKYVEEETKMTNILFNYSEKEQDVNIDVEPIKYTETSVKSLDLLVATSLSVINSTLEEIQSRSKSSTTNVLLDALNSL